MKNPFAKVLKLLAPLSCSLKHRMVHFLPMLYFKTITNELIAREAVKMKKSSNMCQVLA